MNRRWIRASLLVIASLAAGANARAQQAWDYEIVTFLWASGLDGRESIGGIPVDVEADFSDLVEFVNIGLALRFMAQRERVRWFVEASYVELENDIALPSGPGTAEVTQTYSEGGLSYDLTPKLAAYGGIRYQGLETDFEAQPFQLSSNEDWVDGFAGLRWTPLFLDTWVAWARGDIGGGGSDFTWLAEAGAGYRFEEIWSAYFAYRVLDTDYSHNDFVYDMRQDGFMLGFGFRF